MKKNARRWLLLGCLMTLFSGCPDNSSPAPIPPPSHDGGTRTPPNMWRAAVGASGAFTQTFDEQTWQARVVAAQDLFAVACVGNLHGWVVGAAGFAARTEDGGTSFHGLTTGLSETLRAVRFADLDNGILAGDGGALTVTHDGGDHFVAIAALTSQTLRGAAFAGSASLALVVGDAGVVLRSSDGGQTFAIVPPFTNSDLTAVAIDEAATLVLIVDRAGGIWASRDHGATFSQEALAGSALTAVSLVEPPLALAAGAAGTVMRRQIDGTWIASAVTGSASQIDFNAALITDDGSFSYLAGAHGTLLRSADGGSTWQTLNSGTTATLYGLEDL